MGALRAGRVLAAALLAAAATLLAAPSLSRAATAGYSALYIGESVFQSVAAGDSGQFSVIFFNDGSQAWLPGVVGLLVCASDKTTCGVPWNPQYNKGWYSQTVYATVTSAVQPGQTGFFVYSFAVPAGTPAGTVMTLYGDVGLIATGAVFRPQGYYHVNTVPVTLTVSPSTLAIGVSGMQQFTVGGTVGVSVSVVWSVSGGCGTITQTGLFIATAMNSPAQPCRVIASALGRSGSVPVTVYGNVSQLACSAPAYRINADGGSANAGTVVATISVLDPNGNLVANATSPQINTINVTPLLATMTPIGPLLPASGIVAITITSTTVPGLIQLSASAGAVTGCNLQVTSVGAGAASATAATFLANPVAADGISTSTLQIDVTDAKGIRVSSDNATQISITRTGALTCSIVGFTQGVGVSLGPATAAATAVQGRVGFIVQTTTTPGQCAMIVMTNNSSIAGTTASLTTRGATVASALAVLTNDGPHPAGRFAGCVIGAANPDPSCTTIVVGVIDASGQLQTSDTGRAILATLDPGSCAGAGGGDVVQRTSTVTNGGKATFLFSSGGAYAACAITFTAQGLLGLNTTAAWTAGPADHLGCVFTPSTIAAGSGAMPIGVVSVRDALGNVVIAGTYSVSFQRVSGGATMLASAGQQYTSAGYAYFTVRASGGSGIDTWTPSLYTGTLAGGATTCTIGAY